MPPPWQDATYCSTDGILLVSIKFVCRKKLLLFLGKSLKLLPPEPFILALICTKALVACSFALDPTREAYSAPPDPLAGLG